MTKTTTLDVRLAMQVARRAASAGGAAALARFGGELEVERKPDGSPVTAADREAEAAILSEIRRVFPGHAVLAEESGEIAGAEGASCRWIVDPLDGTRGFRRGGSFWGPLVALEKDGQIVAGSVALPALGETYWAGRGLGCFRNGERVRVSRVSRLDEATLSLGEMKNLLGGKHGTGVLSLLSRVESARSYGDLAGCTMLLSGRAEVWLEQGVQAWDVAALAILVEEAGGRFSAFDGSASILRGEAVATNGVLHQEVVAALAAS